jgi:hypothetical protein
MGSYPQLKDTRVEELLKSVRNVAFTANFTPPKTELISNPQVNQLWEDHLSGAGKTSSFAFRERLLVCAMTVFGSDMLAWFDLQKQNPYMSALHKNFLNDTLGFIDTGKRSVSVTTWMSLVGISQTVQSSPGTTVKTKEFFRTDSQPGMRRPTAICDVLVQWTSQPSGFDDLLSTMAIIFGNKD